MKRFRGIITLIIGVILCVSILICLNVKKDGYKLQAEKDRNEINIKYEEELRIYKSKEPYYEEGKFENGRYVAANKEGLQKHTNWELSKPNEPVESLELVDKTLDNNLNKISIMGYSLIGIISISLIILNTILFKKNKSIDI